MYRVLYFIVLFKQLKMLRIDYNIIAKLRPLWLFAFPVCASSYYSLSPFFFVFVSGSFFFAYLLNCSNRFHSTNINILKMCKREGNTHSLSLSRLGYFICRCIVCAVLFSGFYLRKSSGEMHNTKVDQRKLLHTW